MLSFRSLFLWLLLQRHFFVSSSLSSSPLSLAPSLFSAVLLTPPELEAGTDETRPLVIWISDLHSSDEGESRDEPTSHDGDWCVSQRERLGQRFSKSLALPCLWAQHITVLMVLPISQDQEDENAKASPTLADRWAGALAYTVARLRRPSHDEDSIALTDIHLCGNLAASHRLPLHMVAVELLQSLPAAGKAVAREAASGVGARHSRTAPPLALALAGVWLTNVPYSPSALFFIAKSMNSGNGAEETAYKFRNAARPVICNGLLTRVTLTLNDLRLHYSPAARNATGAPHHETAGAASANATDLWQADFEPGQASEYQELELECACDFEHCFSAAEYARFLRRPDPRALPITGVAPALPPPSNNASFATEGCGLRGQRTSHAVAVRRLLEAGGVSVVLTRIWLGTMCNFFIGMSTSQGMELTLPPQEDHPREEQAATVRGREQAGRRARRGRLAAQRFTRSALQELSHGAIPWAFTQGPGLTAARLLGASELYNTCSQPDAHTPVSREECFQASRLDRGLVWLQVREGWAWNERTATEALNLLLGDAA